MEAAVVVKRMRLSTARSRIAGLPRVRWGAARVEELCWRGAGASGGARTRAGCYSCEAG